MKMMMALTWKATRKEENGLFIQIESSKFGGILSELCKIDKLNNIVLFQYHVF
jgi:hypothetical protein